MLNSRHFVAKFLSNKELNTVETQFIVVRSLVEHIILGLTLFNMNIWFKKFGWRTIIAGEFTFTTIRRVQAIYEHLRPIGGGSAAVMSYDIRLLGGQFAAHGAKKIVASGSQALFSNDQHRRPPFRTLLGVVHTAFLKFILTGRS